jgi:protein-export membrane protein SecD
MHKKKRKFIYVVVFTLIMAMIALPLIQYLPDSTQQYFKNVAINLGLDLQGGLHLEYALDLSKVPDDKQDDAKTAVQAVVERRVNAYGVGEPIVQLAHRGGETFLIVEFPGAKEMEDVKDAIQTTPFLIFKEEKTEDEINAEKEEMKSITDPMNEESKTKAVATLDRAKNGEDFGELAKEISQDPGNKDDGGVLDFAKKGSYVEEFDNVLFNDDFKDGEVWPELVETEFGWHIIKKVETKGEGDDKEVKAQHILLRKMDIPVDPYKDTELTGEFLDRADLSFGGQGMGGGISEPQVNLQFNSEGAKMFADITKRNLGKTVAIYLDDQVVSAPTVQAEIVDGNAVISGNFTTDEAKELSQRLNEGALPVPITLVSQQSVEATLGAEALEKGLKAGAVGLILVMLYMILYYRFFGFIAAVSLGIYAATLITIFKLSSLTPMSITLTLAGIAGLVLSIGMAVDANVLIFERIKEELILGKNLKRAVDQGFDRAWPSIRDGNVSTILTSMILMMMGTGFVKGFALILILGVLVSMFTAIVLVKIIVRFSSGEWLEKRMWLIMSPKKLNQDKK